MSRGDGRAPGGNDAPFLKALLHSRLNLLLAVVPFTWLLSALLPGSPWVFVLASLSIVPLAGLVGKSTDELSTQAGPTLGGLLNATFGNAAELIIGIVALRANHIALVHASITGSIIGNLLLVFGLSMFVGGLGRRSQHFNRTVAGNLTIMLFLCVVALTVPAVFDLSLFGSLEPRPPVIYRLSFWTSCLLIVAYAGSLVYAFTTQRDLFRDAERAQPAPRRAARAEAIVLLAVATVLTTVQAEILVHALEPTLAALGFTELFTGVIVIAIVGNAAEHYSAIVAARQDKMTLAMEIAVGSSAQIALLVAPALVLISFAIGRPMSLLFHPFEIVAVALSVFATAIVALDGESNWVEGLQLMAVYVILGLAFFLIPGS
jgi:Ca2+:H+ antiporter